MSPDERGHIFLTNVALHFFFIRGSVHFKTENLQNYKAEKQKKNLSQERQTITLVHYWHLKADMAL